MLLGEFHSGPEGEPANRLAAGPAGVQSHESLPPTGLLVGRVHAELIHFVKAPRSYQPITNPLKFHPIETQSSSGQSEFYL